MTFSEEYIALCIENAGKFGEWEPNEGDWCVTRCGKAYFLVRTVTDNAFYVRSGSHKVRLELTTDDVIWLPTLRQLIDMLEEREYEWMLWRRGQMKFYRCEFKRPKNLDGIPVRRTEGPDPKTAMLKALMSLRDTEGEVRKEE